ncbi:MAG: ATP-grasp domain-containing protein [Clostridia bacterium]|nr:ATP-grasp domain-containing protein [Clostridia bacterium]
MNFVFISPNFPSDYCRFCVCLKRNGVNVLGIGDESYDSLRPELKEALTEYYKVDSFFDRDQLIRAMGYLTFRYGKIDWVESNNEYWMETDAYLRTQFNITTGLKSEDISRYRSKSEMKKYYALAGVPTARWILCEDRAACEEFVRSVGYPVVVKPDRGVGAAATWKLKNDAEFADFFDHLPRIPYIMEEFVKGEVTTFDGVCDSESNVLFAASHTTVNSIMDMVNEGVPVFYYVHKQVAPDVRSAGERVLKAFDVKSRFFHLEFFRLTADREGLGKKGDIIGLEVNMRPAGGFTPDMLNFSQSADCYQIWADMVAFDGAVHDYPGKHYYCVCCGRRDEVNYTCSADEIAALYPENICRMTRMPDALAGTMGNEIIIANFDTIEAADRFVRAAFSPIPAGILTPDSAEPDETATKGGTVS